MLLFSYYKPGGMCSGSCSLFTDLLFSQMIVECTNENKNRARLMNANATGWGWENEKIEHFSRAPRSRAHLARALVQLIFREKITRLWAEYGPRDHDFSSFGVYCLPFLNEGK